MKKVVCVVDNHLYLEYGKTYEVVSERDLEYKLSRDYYGSSHLDIAELYWCDKSFFVSLEEFRNEKIDRIVE
jgi:hypothetical protein